MRQRLLPDCRLAALLWALWACHVAWPTAHGDELPASAPPSVSSRRQIVQAPPETPRRLAAPPVAAAGATEVAGAAHDAIEAPPPDAAASLTASNASFPAADTAAPQGDTPADGPQAAPDNSAPRAAGSARAVDEPSIAIVPFNGVEVGVTRLADVRSEWGEPIEAFASDQTERYRYHIEPFERVEVTFADGKALSIMITLAEFFPPDEVAKHLDLGRYAPVPVTDEAGVLLGQAYPERGVIFTFRGGEKSPLVERIVLDVIDAEPFLLRAETRLDNEDYAACLQDVNTALELSPESARGHWVRAKLLACLGRRTDALAACRRAVALAPEEPEYLITRAELLAVEGGYDDALADAEQAIELSEARPELKALALWQMGNLLAEGPRRDYRQAVNFHLQAIKLAEPLAAHSSILVRHTARQVLLDGHLAVAQDIAWGNWKTKETVVPQWLARAEALAGDTRQAAPTRQGEQYRVCQQALAAFVGLDGKLDPKPWVEKLVRLGRQRIESAADPLSRRQLEWSLGLGLYDALQVYDTRNETDNALEYGGLAVTYMERGLPGRQEAPGDAYLLGRLYWRMGMIYALGRKDHAEAVGWFDKAAPLLERPIPLSALADPGRQGESLVGMAVSYWNTDQRERALALTRRGAELMVQAVKQGIMDSSALAVPYSNLATMHRQLGEADRAQEYTELAAEADGTIRR